MEKVKVSEYQAEALKNINREEESPWWVLDAHANGPGSWMNSYEGLNGMHIGCLAQALFIGYEIEPEQPKFQEGDRIIYKDNPKEILMVISPDGNHEDYRHATPEEVFWLETLGREKVSDYQYGDILTNSEHIPFVIANKTDIEAGFIQKECAEEYRRKLDLKGLLPAQAFKLFPLSDSKN